MQNKKSSFFEILIFLNFQKCVEAAISFLGLTSELL